MGEPQVYGKYELLSRVATGGMAEVWLARSSSIGGFEKILAIKRMHPRLSSNADFVSMFIEEAKLTVALNHPNVVQIFDFGCVDDDYYIAMEYVEGFDLATLGSRARQDERPIPIDASLFVLSQVFEGLAYAHGRRSRRNEPAGIIHRDISPHNVLVSVDGQVKISDFGIAKAAEEISATGEIVGKVAYISPEQAQGEQLTPAADLWSAGVVLHEILTNQRLFARDNEPDTIEAVLESEVPPPSSINPDVPDSVDAIVLSLLTRDLDQRPSDARAIAEQLSDVLRTAFPRTNAHRLADVVREIWGDEMPDLLSADTARPGAPVFDATVPASTWGTYEPSDTEVRPSRIPPPRAASERTLAEAVETTQVGDADVQREVERLQMLFHTEPSLWVLVDIAEAYRSANRISRALGVYRLAAGKFAQGGFLVQAAAIVHQILDLVGGDSDADQEIARLESLEGISNEELFERIFTDADDDPHVDEYREMLEASGPAPGPNRLTRAPILSSLGAEALVGLVRAMRPHHVMAGQVIIREGDDSDSFFWIGRGRVVVSTRDFENKKVYLTALAEGDCFGEQAFFTQKPRTASVETAESAWLLEVDRDALDALVREFPVVEDTLRQFYKDRIAESLLARSPFFGRLSARDRRAMAERFHFQSYGAEELVINEGEHSDAFYAIRSGQLVVSCLQEGEKLVIAELGPGDIFGEMAALKGTPRTASVETKEECELLVLDASDLKGFVASNPDLAERIEQQMEARARARSAKFET